MTTTTQLPRYRTIHGSKNPYEIKCSGHFSRTDAANADNKAMQQLHVFLNSGDEAKRGANYKELETHFKTQYLLEKESESHLHQETAQLFLYMSENMKRLLELGEQDGVLEKVIT